MIKCGDTLLRSSQEDVVTKWIYGCKRKKGKADTGFWSKDEIKLPLIKT